MSYSVPIINIHLDGLGYQPQFIGLLMAVTSINFALSLMIVPKFTKKLTNRGTLFVGFVI